VPPPPPVIASLALSPCRELGRLNDGTIPAGEPGVLDPGELDPDELLPPVECGDGESEEGSHPPGDLGDEMVTGFLNAVGELGRLSTEDRDLRCGDMGEPSCSA